MMLCFVGGLSEAWSGIKATPFLGHQAQVANDDL
jgi:hypothetical protein